MHVFLHIHIHTHMYIYIHMSLVPGPPHPPSDMVPPQPHKPHIRMHLEGTPSQLYVICSI